MAANGFRENRPKVSGSVSSRVPGASLVLETSQRNRTTLRQRTRSHRNASSSTSTSADSTADAEAGEALIRDESQQTQTRPDPTRRASRREMMRRALRSIHTSALMVPDKNTPVPETIGGKEFLIPPDQVADLVSLEDVDHSLPAARSSVESEKFLLEFKKVPIESDGVAHGEASGEWEAALIITGTAVGGGSLALPYFCAAGGFIPACCLLLISYALLLGSALILVEPTIRVWEDKPGCAVSMHSVVETYLGKYWGYAAGVTFWILINCTLVSQLAKCGELTALFFGHDVTIANGAGRWIGRFGSVISANAIAFAAFDKKIGKINALATSGLFLGFLGALCFGAGGVNPQLLALGSWTAAVPALPAIAQTMTYAEAIPTVVDMCRGSRVKVRRVLALGSLGPALMYALWLAVTLGRASLADFASGGGDLAAKILAEGGALGAATATIATCASVSTLIGCYLALSRFHADTFKMNLSRRNLKLVALTVVPSLVVSMKGPEMYHLMIKFAGTVPVAFLWGVMPPLVMWKMLKGDGKLTKKWRGVLGAGALCSAVAMVVGARSM